MVKLLVDVSLIVLEVGVWELEVVEGADLEVVAIITGDCDRIGVFSVDGGLSRRRTEIVVTLKVRKDVLIAERSITYYYSQV